MISGFLICRLFILIISSVVLSGSSSDIGVSLDKLEVESKASKSNKTLVTNDNIKNAKDFFVNKVKACGKNLVDDICHFANKAPGLSPKVLSHALHAYKVAKDRNEVSTDKLTIIDYSKPSTEDRLWVLDLEEKKVNIATKVAHGSGSGGHVIAKKFSNKNNSHASSIGVAKTKGIYYGKHGKSLRLEGLEEGINDHLLDRAVVIHGANYVNKNGRVGRSWGCPAVSNDIVGPLVDEIKDGSLVFLYYPDQKWIENSEYL